MPWCATSTSKPRKHEVKRSMSIIEPKIDVLLDRTDNDRFLLCALASKRAHDINDMMRGQRDRAIQLQTAVEIARAADKKPLSLAFNEIARGEVSYDPNSIDIKNHLCTSKYRLCCKFVRLLSRHSTSHCCICHGFNKHKYIGRRASADGSNHIHQMLRNDFRL